MIFTDQMISHITSQTNLYANRDKNNHGFLITESEMRQFLGILLLSGYNILARETDYWSTQPDLGVDIVCRTMSRNRFQEIKACFHLADNNKLEKGNKMAKVSPLYEMLNDSLTQYGIMHQYLSIDESMVPYHGKHSSKMFLKAKPIRFGYKLWALCGHDGYPYRVSIYQGKNPERNVKEPLGSSVVKDFVNIVRKHGNVYCHEFYFDNFFTSYSLLADLAESEVQATGTVRENRTCGASKAMISSAEMKKKDRGSFDYRCDGIVYVSKWHDNSIVSLASNWQSHIPVKEVKRRVKGGSQLVPQPCLVRAYNKGMGGVDLLDRLLGAYRLNLRSKKWYFPLFLNALNMSVVASWRLHSIHEKDSKKKLSHYDFRRSVTLCLLQCQEGARKSRATCGPPEDVRQDSVGHIPSQATQGRCVVCGKNT